MHTTFVLLLTRLPKRGRTSMFDASAPFGSFFMKCAFIFILGLEPPSPFISEALLLLPCPPPPSPPPSLMSSPLPLFPTSESMDPFLKCLMIWVSAKSTDKTAVIRSVVVVKHVTRKAAINQQRATCSSPSFGRES